MIKNAAACLILLLTVACATSPMTSSNDVASPAPGVATKYNDAPLYILLSSPNQVRTVDYSSKVYGLHLRGTMTNKGFYPAGQIEGKGKFCADGKDWLSLSEMKVYTAADNKTPNGPYILGCSTGSGFQPASREVVLQ
jgi:hypothetical protein